MTEDTKQGADLNVISARFVARVKGWPIVKELPCDSKSFFHIFGDHIHHHYDSNYRWRMDEWNPLQDANQLRVVKEALLYEKHITQITFVAKTVDVSFWQEGTLMVAEPTYSHWGIKGEFAEHEAVLECVKELEEHHED